MSPSAPAARVEPVSAAPPGHQQLPREVGGGFVAVLAFCGIAVSVMQTLVVPLVTELPQLLHTSSSNASWVITATLLGLLFIPLFFVVIRTLLARRRQRRAAKPGEPTGGVAHA